MALRTVKDSAGLCRTLPAVIMGLTHLETQPFFSSGKLKLVVVFHNESQQARVSWAWISFLLYRSMFVPPSTINRATDSVAGGWLCLASLHQLAVWPNMAASAAGWPAGWTAATGPRGPVTLAWSQAVG